MKLSLIALFLLAVAASAEETATNAVADKVQASITDLVDVEENVADATSSRRRRRRWHGHHPHAHWPHGHRPHGHWPHGHRPHFHFPHGHRPHFHVPHGHRPHAHWPHLHWPALGKFFERAWDAFTGPFIAFGELVASLPWAEIAGSIARWTMKNIIGPIADAVKWILDRIMEFGEMLWLIFNNPCKISISDFVTALTRCWTAGKASYNGKRHDNDSNAFSMMDAAERSMHAIAGTACTLTVIWFEAMLAGINVLLSVVLMLANSCKVFRDKNPTMRIALACTGTVTSTINKFDVTAAIAMGFDKEYNKFCYVGVQLLVGFSIPPSTDAKATVGAAPSFGLGTPGSGTWVNVLAIGLSLTIPLFNLSFAFSLNYKYAKKLSKFREIGGSISIGVSTKPVDLSFKVQTGKAFCVLCYLAGHFEGLTCNEHYGARDGGGSNQHTTQAAVNGYH